jgi:hypothetical protein
MHPLWARLLPAMLSLAPAPKPSLKLKLRPPPLISLVSAPAAAPPASPSLWPVLQLSPPGAGSGLRLSDTLHLTAGQAMKSTGVSLLFTVRPGVELGVRPAVETFDTPSGRLRAAEGFAVLRVRF